MASSIQLINGQTIPTLAYGSGTRWYKNKNRELINSIKEALSLGFRHLDAAESYGNEEEMGIAIQEFLAENKDVKREDIFVTTKVYPSITDAHQALVNSLQRLKLSYVDLFLIHAPFFSNIYKGSIRDVWEKMEKTVDDNLAKSIGVSNFRVEDLEQLTDVRIKPVVNQIEFNPYLQQRDIYEKDKQLGIITACYSPLISLTLKQGGPVDKVVDELAKKYNRSAAQILINWSLSKNNVVVTTSNKKERLIEYLDVLNNPFKLEEAEISRIDNEGAKLHHRQYWQNEFPKP